MKVRFALTALLAVSTLAFVACGDEDEDPNGPPDTNTFTANLTGGGERPTVTTAATGSATFTATTTGSTTTITYTVTVTGNLSGPAAAAHIHGPADANSASTAANIIVPLTITGTGTTGNIISGSFTTTGHATINMAQLLTHMLAGNTYINVHTAANPLGEIRGQISD